MNKMQTIARIQGGAHENQSHESGHKHVAGTAEYIDDIAEPAGTLHAYLGFSERAHANVTDMDFADVLSCEGVVGILTHKDIPGVNDLSPLGLNDEPILITDKVEFFGQPLFAVIAKTRAQARLAARKAKVTYHDLPHQLDAREAKAADYPMVVSPMKLERGDIAAGFKTAKHIVSGSMQIGGQDHFYLEGQISFAVPGEDDDVTIYSSTQHPTETQHMVAHALHVPSNAVTIQVRRMGGGFGGKETQANLFACVAAIAAKKYRAPVKIRLDRDDDMEATGKRHDFYVDYQVGFDDDGRIEAVDASFMARCGFCADLSGAVTDRALFHADNAYFYPNVRLVSRPQKTNTVSNTAFRGFGGPQGVVGAERIMEEIGYYLGKDPLEIRKVNFYGTDDRNLTPYYQTVEDNIIQRVVAELEESSDYAARREKVLEFNRNSRVIKRGIALTPVKFGISFTKTEFNQAGALVHIYTDGSVQVNHGGTEMGQGLYTKVAQIVAEEFQIDLKHIKATATRTDKVPNTSATAASSGTDLNGMAAADAARQIKARLVNFACETYKIQPEEVVFEPNNVRLGAQVMTFPQFIQAAYAARVQLSAAGFYKTPKIHWDRDEGKGRPFLYYAYGASVSEVSIDTLTGEYQVERADVLHDVGKSINPALDIGQVEGAFVQGMGWLTTEELWWDNKGRLRTHAPSTYKIPLASDRPRIFNVNLASWSVNREETIRRSKAVGEPPFMLPISVFEALSMAVASTADYRVNPRLDAPATPERILMALQRLKKQQSA
ncbi:xanthine dehydrogenase large subunit [Paenochrobactrum gallinarii]|uniref:Xanthine dehydrogenase large subunit n=1 Tax=Paenochrobactrum gallinarii TaxID=643673 RepID=A0A841LUN9_9HYPH|nr:xanthine dehydrogenase molybdopterin binding subunit [Paenochrobactrum gallinarii]MBB6260590.1 xanthine dehydrogenase large subunit [Paenochrobactrum gallinarii]